MSYILRNTKKHFKLNLKYLYKINVKMLFNDRQRLQNYENFKLVLDKLNIIKYIYKNAKSFFIQII